MSKIARKAVARVTAIILFLVGAFPERVLALISNSYLGIFRHPVRAVLVTLAFLLLVYSFWDWLLDILGIHSMARLERDIRGWLDSFNYHTKPEVDDQTNFKFTVTPESGQPPLTVANVKDRPHYVMIGSRIGLAESDQKFFNSLTVPEQIAVRANVAIILARSRTSFSYSAENEITIERRVPVTADLTEHVFMMAMDDFHHARYGALNALLLIFAEARKGKSVAQAAAANATTATAPQLPPAELGEDGA